MADFLPQLVDRTHGTLPTVHPHWVPRFGSSWFGEPRLLMGSVFEPTSLSQTTPTSLDWESIDADAREGDPWRSLLPPEEIHGDFLTLAAFLDQRETLLAEAKAEITETQFSTRVNRFSIQAETPAQPAAHLPQQRDASASFEPSVSKTLQPKSVLSHRIKTQETLLQRRDRPTFPLVSLASPNSPSVLQNQPLGDLTTSKPHPTAGHPLASSLVSEISTFENSPLERSPDRFNSEQPPTLPLQTTFDLPPSQASIASPSVPIAADPPVPLSSPSPPSSLSPSSSPRPLASFVSQPLSHISGLAEAPVSLSHRSEITNTPSDSKLDTGNSMLRSPPDSVRQPQAERQLKVNVTSHLTPLNPSITPSVVARLEPSPWQADIASRDRQNPDLKQNLDLKIVSNLEITSTPLPTIEISIGRIEVRVKSAETTRAKSQPRSTARGPQLSLSDYLQNRNGQTEGGSP